MLRQVASKGGEKWKLVSSICLMRKPVISKELTDLEKRMQNLMHQIEDETSWKSDWELTIEKDMEDLKKIKDGAPVGRKLCRDWEDEWKVEREKCSLGPRITEADRKNDVTSSNRLLDQSLILIVQQNASGNNWIFPHGGRAPDETMRQAAERVLQETCGDNLKVQFYGNAPCGYYKFKYPKNQRKEFEGDKVFFYKAFVTGGAVKPSPALKQFKWVASNQLSSVLPPKYGQSVEMFLLNTDN